MFRYERGYRRSCGVAFRISIQHAHGVGLGLGHMLVIRRFLLPWQNLQAIEVLPIRYIRMQALHKGMLLKANVLVVPRRVPIHQPLRGDNNRILGNFRLLHPCATKVMPLPAEVPVPNNDTGHGRRDIILG